MAMWQILATAWTESSVGLGGDVADLGDGLEGEVADLGGGLDGDASNLGGGRDARWQNDTSQTYL